MFFNQWCRMRWWIEAMEPHIPPDGRDAAADAAFGSLPGCVDGCGYCASLDGLAVDDLGDGFFDGAQVAA